MRRFELQAIIAIGVVIVLALRLMNNSEVGSADVVIILVFICLILGALIMKQRTRIGSSDTPLVPGKTVIRVRTPVEKILGATLLLFSLFAGIFLMRFSRVRSGDELDLYFLKTDKEHGWYILLFIILVLIFNFSLMVCHERRNRQKE